MSLWLCICPLGECHVALLDSLCGCNVFAKVSCLLSLVYLVTFTGKMTIGIKPTPTWLLAAINMIAGLLATLNNLWLHDHQSR